MNKYELTVIVNAVVEEEVRVAVIEKIKELIVRFGGTVSGIDEAGKKRLAYDIQKMSDGFYYFIHFDAVASCPSELEAQLRIMDNVLRFLCVRIED